MRRPTVLVPLALRVEDFSRKRRIRNRFFVRCSLGLEIALAAGHVVRVFTLTESDYAIGMGLDFGDAVHKFFIKMHHDYGSAIARYVVTHASPGKGRMNRHVICYGTGRLDVLDLDKHWHKVYGSKLTGMERLWSPRGFTFYLSKYLAKGDEEFVKASMSPRWVFPGWWRFNLAYHKAYGEYPPLELFVGLLRLPEDVRRSEVSELLRIWSL